MGDGLIENLGVEAEDLFEQENITKQEEEDLALEQINTGENFCNFLTEQQNQEASFIPKKFAYRNTFETYISQFLQAFSLDDVEKYDLFAHKKLKILILSS